MSCSQLYSHTLSGQHWFSLLRVTYQILSKPVSEAALVFKQEDLTSRWFSIILLYHISLLYFITIILQFSVLL